MIEPDVHPDDKHEGHEVKPASDHPDGVIEDDPRVPPSKKEETADSPRLATPASP